MENVNAVFFDIDGTLADFETHSIPQITIDAIYAMKKKGIKVALATNRSFRFLNEIDGINHIEWDGYVLNGGGEVRNNDKEIVFENKFSRKMVDDIFGTARISGVPLFYFDGKRNVTMMNEDMGDFLEEQNLFPVMIEEEWEKKTIEIVSVCEKNTQRTKNIFNKIKGVRVVEYENSYLELYPKGVSKANGIKEMMNYWNLPEGSYAAFGDTRNDNQMLKRAALGLAMPWAETTTKKSGHATCMNLGEKTIAFALKHFGIL